MNARILSGQFKICGRLAVLAEAHAASQLRVGGGKPSLCKQGKAQRLAGKNTVNRVVGVLGALQQMFGKGLSFTKRSANEIPGPKTKHRRQDMFVKPALLAQVERSRVRMPHTLGAPAVDRPEGVAERNLEQQLR